jgi:hypothetical protein
MFRLCIYYARILFGASSLNNTFSRLGIILFFFKT